MVSVVAVVVLAAVALREDGRNMKIKRIFRHFLTLPWRIRQIFPQQAMTAIEATIKKSESSHYGEIRFAVEAALDVRSLLAGKSARERAVEVFSQLRVWDTERNNGVLIYLLLADRDVEIVADRGIHQAVGQPGWENICREMEQVFGQGRFEEGAISGIREVARHLARHYPAPGENVNELPNAPVVL